MTEVHCDTEELSWVDRRMQSCLIYSKRQGEGFPGGSGVKNPPANAGDTGSIPDWGYPTCHRAAKPVLLIL